MRSAIIAIISLVPFNGLRIFLYRHLLGYKIGKNVKISPLNYIDANNVEIHDDVTIRGILNIFIGLNKLLLEEGCFIGGPRAGFNFVRGRKRVNSEVVFKVGKCAHIELFHYFDVCDSIIIGNNTVIGGIKSVFWTHTFYKEEFSPVIIGDDCFIGSNVLINQGVNIAKGGVVAMGAVVTKSFDKEKLLIGGVPAQVIKEDFDYDAKAAFKLRNIKYWGE